MDAKLLDNPEFFFCERFRATMKRSVCVERQGKKFRGCGVVMHLECQGCGQGMRIKEEIDMNTVTTEGTSKVCTKCGQLKPLDEFVKSKQGKYGRRSSCKVCDSATAKERYAKGLTKMQKKRKRVAACAPVEKTPAGTGIDVDRLATAQRIADAVLAAIADDVEKAKDGDDLRPPRFLATAVIYRELGGGA